MIYTIIIICLIIAIIYFATALSNHESFKNLDIYPSRMYGMAKYVRLNKFNRVEAIYIKPPLPKTGESRCDVVTCPEWIPDNSTCYKCI
jgi:hypothetical protein